MQENGKDESSLDDLFRILARPDFDKIRSMHAEHVSQYRRAHNGHYPSTENVSFMKYYGWTWLEFVKEQHRRNLPVR